MTVNHEFLSRIQGKRGLLYALLLAVLVSFPHYLGEPIGGALLSSAYSTMAAGLAFAWFVSPWIQAMVKRTDGLFHYALHAGSAVLLGYVAIEAAMLPWFVSGGYSAVTSLLCEITVPLAGALAVRPEQLVAAWARKGQLVQAAVFLCGMWSLATTFIVQGESDGTRSCRSGLAKPLQLLPFASVVLSVFGARSAFASLGPLVFDVPLRSAAGAALSFVPAASVLVSVVVTERVFKDDQSHKRISLAAAAGLMGWSVLHRSISVVPEIESAAGVAAIVASLSMSCAIVLLRILHASKGVLSSSALACDVASDEPPSVEVAALSEFQLAPREREVASLALRGKTSAEIGAALGVQASTVRSTLRRVYAKASVSNLDELKQRVAPCRIDGRPCKVPLSEACDPGRTLASSILDLAVRVDVVRSFMLQHPFGSAVGAFVLFALAGLVESGAGCMLVVMLFWVLLIAGGGLGKFPDVAGSEDSLPYVVLWHCGCFVWGLLSGLTLSPLIALLGAGVCAVCVGGVLKLGGLAYGRSETILCAAAQFGFDGICGWYSAALLSIPHSAHPLAAGAFVPVCVLAHRALHNWKVSADLFAGSEPSFFERCIFYLRSKGLNEGQANVLVRIAAGESSAKIEDDLNYSRGSVNTARRVGYRALGVHSRTQLMRHLQRTCTSSPVHTTSG